LLTNFHYDIEKFRLRDVKLIRKVISRIVNDAGHRCGKVDVVMTNDGKVYEINSEFLGHDYYTDIIQINSKSGLRGSNKNFAYAGAKFGGIGLTQSFALELAPFRIKVNSICPGNFYEGPLWSDPQNGLFVQYLRTGKVPGAKTIDDVRKFYENQVPMKRGCRLEDVIKALLYIIDQEYETGQAVPVTGGQVMLG